MMRHSPPVRGYRRKLKSTPSQRRDAVCTVLPTRGQEGCLPVFQNKSSIVLGLAQSSRIGRASPLHRTGMAKTMPHRAVSKASRASPQRFRFGIIRDSA